MNWRIEKEIERLIEMGYDNEAIYNHLKVLRYKISKSKVYRYADSFRKEWNIDR